MDDDNNHSEMFNRQNFDTILNSFTKYREAAWEKNGDERSLQVKLTKLVQEFCRKIPPTLSQPDEAVMAFFLIRNFKDFMGDDNFSRLDQELARVKSSMPIIQELQDNITELHGKVGSFFISSGENFPKSESESEHPFLGNQMANFAIEFEAKRIETDYKFGLPAERTPLYTFQPVIKENGITLWMSKTGKRFEERLTAPAP